MRIVKRLTNESEKYWPTCGAGDENCWWEHAVLSDKNAKAAVEEGVAEYYPYAKEVYTLSAYNTAKETDHVCTAKPADPTEE